MDLMLPLCPTDDPRARFIGNQDSKGICKARNTGFRAAKGQFLRMLDDDAWYLPEKLERQLEYLLEDPKMEFPCLGAGRRWPGSVPSLV
jgi:glycosyltransferase involved in cell wall biosynthesis